MQKTVNIEARVLNVPDRFPVAKLDNLHVLIRVVHHAQVLHPLQPARNIRRQVAAKQLRRQRVQGADGDRHLHVHAQRSHEEPDALRKTNVFQLGDGDNIYLRINHGGRECRIWRMQDIVMAGYNNMYVFYLGDDGVQQQKH